MTDRQRSCIRLIVLSCLLIGVDRITKHYALVYLWYPWTINPYLSFYLSINRGISWGILSFANNHLFILLTACIIAITGVLAWYIWHQLCQGLVPIGEILIATGACSNIIDRVFYGGVIDFILLSCGSWSFPIFNIADICIVIGAGLMLMSVLQEQ